jgi:hypothetical protein
MPTLRANVRRRAFYMSLRGAMMALVNRLILLLQQAELPYPE